MCSLLLSHMCTLVISTINNHYEVIHALGDSALVLQSLVSNAPTWCNVWQAKRSGAPPCFIVVVRVSNR